MRGSKRILIINPDTAETEIGIFEGTHSIYEQKIPHNIPYDSYTSIANQVNRRKKDILNTLSKDGMNLSRLGAIGARGGILKPVHGGTYLVSKDMLYDLRNATYGEHVANLGGILASEIAENLHISAYIVDPVVVDELNDISRISGHPKIERKSIFHALNHKYVGYLAAEELGLTYGTANLIIAHLGKGATIAAHKNGYAVDVNNGLDGDGPFTPKRAGKLPTGDLISYIFDFKGTQEELEYELSHKSGFFGYLQTSSLKEVEKMINDDDEKAKKIFQAFVYQVSKEIGAMAISLKGDVDAIVLTGKLTQSSLLVSEIRNQVSWIANIMIYPDVNELQALNEGILRVQSNTQHVKNYERAVE